MKRVTYFLIDILMDSLVVLLLCSISLSSSAKERFVSINLCSDRLLMALAEPDQIAGLSHVVFDPLMSLDPVPEGITAVKGDIETLLPYRQETILIDPRYQRLLYERLKSLGFHLFEISLPQTKEALKIEVDRIAKRTAQPEKRAEIYALLDRKYTPFEYSVLSLEEGLIVNEGPVTIQLNQLLGLKNSANQLKRSKKGTISFESLLMAEIDLLLISKGGNGFSQTSAYLTHPALKEKLSKTELVYFPTKYTICFDQGVWLGASYLSEKIEQMENTQ